MSTILLALAVTFASASLPVQKPKAVSTNLLPTHASLRIGVPWAAERHFFRMPKDSEGYGVGLSRDEKRIVVSASNYDIEGVLFMMFDANTGHELGRAALKTDTYPDRSDGPLPMLISPSGKRFGALLDGGIKLWTLAGKPIVLPKVTDSLEGLAWRDDDTLLVHVGSKIQRWDLTTGQATLLKSIPDGAHGALAPNGSGFAFDANKKVHRFKADGTAAWKVAVPSGGDVMSLEFSPGGASLLVATKTEAAVFDAAGKPKGQTFKPGKGLLQVFDDGSVRGLHWDETPTVSDLRANKRRALNVAEEMGEDESFHRFSPNGRLLLMSQLVRHDGFTGETRLFTSDGKPFKRRLGMAFGYVFNADASRLFLVGDYRTVKRITIKGRKWKDTTPKPGSGNAAATAVAWAGSDTLVVGAPSYLRKVSRSTGKVMRSLKVAAGKRIEVSRDGKVALVNNRELWDLKRGKRLRKYIVKGKHSRVSCAALRPDGAAVAIGVEDVPLEVLDYAEEPDEVEASAHYEAVVNARTGKPKLRLWTDEYDAYTAQRGCSDARFSPDGSQLIVAYSGFKHLWTWSGAKSKKSKKSKKTAPTLVKLDLQLNDFLFAGIHHATWSPGSIELSVPTSGDVTFQWKLNDIRAVDIWVSEVGTVRIVAGTASGAIHVFEPGNKAAIRVMQAASRVDVVAQSPDGKSLASVSVDGSVLVWDLP